MERVVRYMFLVDVRGSGPLTGFWLQAAAAGVADGADSAEAAALRGHPAQARTLSHTHYFTTPVLEIWLA